MRKEMIESSNIVAAIFIGGMEGIEEEFNLFIEFHPNLPIYLMASTGGATRHLYENRFLSLYNNKWNYYNENLINDLKNSKQFVFLAKEIISDILLKREENIMVKKKAPKRKPRTTKLIKILIAHDNRLGYSTTKAHRFADRIDKDKNYKVIYDRDYFNPGEKLSSTEINKRERVMVQKADVIVRIIQPPSKTGEKRHDGALSEVRKGINASKPIIEIYERGARESSTRSIIEVNYKKRVKINLKEGKTIDKAFKTGIEKLRKKGLIK